ncbi:MAG TPA: DUF4870 domain-containing protein, partial [Ornithinibacter sp.]|nr:DUF4870 domain-containing protein [Ornithinibacter sp.]
MSDTTPRPDETPGDPTAPAAPPAAEQPPEQPVYAQPQYTEPQSTEPQYAQQQYTQQQPPPPPPYGAPAPGTAVAPPNPMSPTDERTWGTIAHGGTLAATILSGGTLGFVCALVIYLLYKDRGPFVHHHSANALNVQIFGAILVIGGIILTVTVIGAIIGIPMIIVGGLYVLIVHVIGAIKANNGEWWN